jgi:hypothetical protein
MGLSFIKRTGCKLLVENLLRPSCTLACYLFEVVIISMFVWLEKII